MVRWSFIFLLLAIVLSNCRVSDNNVDYQSITRKRSYNGQPTWSPDGSKIIYRPESNESIVVHELESGNEEQMLLPILGHGYGSITWISDLKMAYTPFPSHPTGRIVIIEPSSNTEEVFHVNSGIFDFCWDQNEKVFIFVTEQLASLSSTSVHGNIVMKFDPESEEYTPLYLASEDHVVTDIACRRGGHRVAIVDRTGDTSSGYTTELKIITLSYLSEQTILESSSKMRFDEPTWSPTGEWIAVRSIEGNLRHPIRGILLIASDGSATKRVDLPWSKGALAELEWSPTDNILLVRLHDGIFDYSLNLFDLTPWIN